MKITLKQLEALGACEEGIAWYKQVGATDLVILVQAAIKEKNYTFKGKTFSTLDFVSWGVVWLMTHKQKTQYAIFAARQVLKIFEDKYPKNKSPRAAIEAAEKWVLDPSEDNKRAAAAASAYAATDAAAYAYAAYAAYAAAASAYAATDAAAYADAAYAAAADVADAKDRMKTKIIHYGVKLLLEKEN